MKPITISILIMSIFIGSFPLKSVAFADAAVVAQLIKNLEEMKKQYDKLKDQYGVMREQYQKLQSLQQDSEGHYGFGNLFNSTQDLNHRQWSPDNWQDALKGLSGGNPSRYQQLVQAYQANHPALSKSDYEKGESSANTKTYESEVETNQAVSVNATYAFNDIKTHLDHVHTLSTQIEKATNTKAAMDLNSRLLTEIAYIQIQELKMQTLLNEQTAESSSSHIAGESAEAKFNQLPTD